MGQHENIITNIFWVSILVGNRLNSTWGAECVLLGMAEGLIGAAAFSLHYHFNILVNNTAVLLIVESLNSNEAVAKFV